MCVCACITYNIVYVILAPLRRDALGHGDGRQAARLADDDGLHGAVLGVEDVLRHLRRLPGARGALDDADLNHTKAWKQHNTPPILLTSSIKLLNITHMI